MYEDYKVFYYQYIASFILLYSDKYEGILYSFIKLGFRDQDKGI